jgi:hypothetical protein
MKLRFSIRDLLWLTLVLALCVAWWIDHSRLYPYFVHAEQMRMYEQIKKDNPNIISIDPPPAPPSK